MCNTVGSVMNLNGLTFRQIYELHNDKDSAEGVDDAFHAVQDTLRDMGLRVANDDRAEKLVDAITEYILASGNLHLGGL